MLVVLLFSDPSVKSKLFERVDTARKPVLVTQLRQDKFARPVDEREPFAAIEDVFGRLVDQIVVADDGTPEGMWRDPVGDLADRFFPYDRNASYAASTGYMLLHQGRVLATVKKQGPNDDLWFLQQALAQFVPGIPPPAPRKPKVEPRAEVPRERRPPPRPGAQRFREEPPPAPTPPPTPAAPDPYALLGIPPGTPLPEAKKAFRALIAQYHPDKVSHLAPEFRELADRKTREILDAWRAIEDAHG